MIKLAISGCLGRMGQRITALANQDNEFQITALLENLNHPQFLTKINGLSIADSADALKGCDALIEFTTPDATREHLAACIKHKVGMVIGTTNCTPDQVKKIKAASKKIPIVFSSNMSIGVNILFKLTQMLAKTTPGSYTVRMVEAHHVHKKDAPSGTAKTLANVIESSSSHKVTDIQSIREGEIVGDHKIIFESAEDIIVLDHHAKSRDIFAKGSLVAAKFVSKKKNGLFSMKEVLGI